MDWQGYNVAWSGNGAELNDLRALDDSIILYWTGSDVNSPITQESIDYVADRTGKKVCFWLNYPVVLSPLKNPEICTDHA